MKKILSFLILLFISLHTFAQGELQGKITDAKSGAVIELANVQVYTNGVFVTGTQADFDGFYTLKPLDPGKYDVVVSYVGFQNTKVEGVIINADKITFLDIKIPQSSSGGVNLNEVVIVQYRVPLLQQDNTTQGGTVTKDEISKMATRNVNSIASTTASVYQKDEGGAINVRGQRSEGTDYYVDGVKVNGSVNIPSSAIEQMTVLTGAMPAKYGDATGGIINITLRGASSKFFGGIELATSELLDGYGHRFASGNLSGPILWKGKKDDPDRRPILGFFIALEYQHDKDPNPSSTDIYTAKDDVLENLRQNPLRFAPDGNGIINNYLFVKKDDLKKIKARPDMEQDQYRSIANFTLSLSKYVDVTVGGSFDKNISRDFAYEYMLFNPENNTQHTENNLRTFVRFTQRFPTDTARNGVFKNAYYSIQADFSRNNDVWQSKVLKDDLFNYGYVGKFTTHRAPVYQYGVDKNTGIQGNLLVGYQDTYTDYSKGSANPYLSELTEQYYQLAGTDTSFFRNVNTIEAGNGMINGSRSFSAQSAYSLWYISGRRPSGYNLAREDQFRISANGSVDVKRPGTSDRNKHAIELGFEYEQRVNRSYGVSASSLYTLMRSITNSHITDLDLSNPIFTIDPVTGLYTDTIKYNRAYKGDEQRQFDKSLRELLGLNVTSLDYVNIDEVDPSLLSLSMFSADDLFAEGSSYVGYYGYDYTGKILNKKPTFADFFKAKDAKGNFERSIDAYRPIYAAVYLQDKFAFKDLIFNVGLRVDRFDANQKVLRDKYSLYGVKTVSEASDFTHPSTVGDDYVVYVTDEAAPTGADQIIGYRNGDDWYDNQGNYVKDPATLAASNGDKLYPYLEDYTVTNKTGNTNIKGLDYDVDAAFKDYVPQITVNPRVSFSFPITSNEEGSGAMFFANYNVLTQRPQGRNIVSPDDYYFFNERFSQTTFSNPDLKPEKTIEYSLGFKQKIGSFSALSISAFYRELRDMVQITGVSYAYPQRYKSYNNVDFGTVKGLDISYDMRRIKNAQLKLAYTLQFAEGTGSGDQSQANLIDAGQPNLKIITPLDIDSRHSITATLDYRFGEGEEYDGPKWFGKNIFQNAGANFIIRARSGEPFTRTNNPIPTQVIGDASRSNSIGAINGSRLPWNFRVDFRLDKDFKIGKDKDANYINAYFTIQNLFNTKNINSVYTYTGNPDDDGYLYAPSNQASIEDQLDTQAFIEQYTIKMNKPSNFSLPRRMRIGVSFNF